MLTIISKTGKIVKEVFIIRRYEIKRGTMAGSICNVVRSIKTVKGQQVVNEYQVWTLRDGVTTCDCESRGDCCHKDEVSFAEMRRCNNIAPVAPRQVAQPVVETAVKEPSLLEQVNEELARVQQPAATAEEVAATAARCPVRNADQVAYFLQLNRRAKALKPVPTPEPRKVSPDWLLGRRNGGTFSGKVA